MILFNREKYLPEFDFVADSKLKCYANMFDKLESEVLYALVRDIKPLHIMELGAHKGWQTHIFLKACRKNKCGEITSFDIIDNSQHFDCNIRKLVVGDARNTALDYIDECDFLFIDADHSEEFTRWYCENLLPRYKKGYIWVHDWYGEDTDRTEPLIIVKSEIYKTSIHQVINLWDYDDKNSSPSQILHKSP